MTHSSIWLLGATAIACSSATYHAPATTTAITLPAPGANAVAIVRISAPWYARNFLIRRRFRAAVGDYERLPGLLRKYFTISDDREFGGIYLWQSRAAADAFYSPAWRARIRDRYDTTANLTVFAAPFVVEGTTRLEPEAIDGRATAYPAVATWLSITGVAEGGEPGLRRLAERHGIPPGLVRAYFITGARDEIGVIALWATSELAEAPLSNAKLRELERALGGTASVVRFEAPVLIGR